MSVNQRELGDILRKGMAEQQESAETEIVKPDPEPVESKEVVEEAEESPEIITEEETEETEEVSTEEITDETTEHNISDLNELATAIEVEPEFLYNIKVPMADGMEPISLSELKDGYTQFKRGTTADLETLEKERVAFEEYKQQQAQSLQMQAEMPQEIMAAQAKALAIASQYQTYDWDALEKENPGQAALERQKLATAYQQAQSEHQGLVQQYQQTKAQEFDEFAKAERVKMLKAIPEWNDNKIRTQEQDQMRGTLREYGFNDQEIDSMTDHRAVRLARDLWQLKQKNQAAIKTLKKVTKVPKRVKSGTVPVATRNAQKLQKTIDAAAKSKNLDVKVQAIGQLLNRG